MQEEALGVFLSLFVVSDRATVIDSCDRLGSGDSPNSSEKLLSSSREQFCMSSWRKKREDLRFPAPSPATFLPRPRPVGNINDSVVTISFQCYLKELNLDFH